MRKTMKDPWKAKEEADRLSHRAAVAQSRYDEAVIDGLPAQELERLKQVADARAKTLMTMCRGMWQAGRVAALTAVRRSIENSFRQLDRLGLHRYCPRPCRQPRTHGALRAFYKG